MSQHIIFRVDASTQIGTGHVMRCLTLADAFKSHGAESQFVCREHPGNLIELIRNKGHVVHVLPLSEYKENTSLGDSRQLTHAHWLGTGIEEDAEQTIRSLGDFQANWLIVDHYALDAEWETKLREKCHKLMVIDDLADRKHDCDLLLDQNLGRKEMDYQGKVPGFCKIRTGPFYALLRPDFEKFRDSSLERRKLNKYLGQLLITMGGIDKDNITGLVLSAIEMSDLSKTLKISVIMGDGAPWLENVKQQAKNMSFSTEVLVNVTDMARRMAEADLSIGAAGSTSWERCCLGLPTILCTLAINQEFIANKLEEIGAAVLVNSIDFKTQMINILNDIVKKQDKLNTMSLSASTVTDGHGVRRILSEMCK